ncbi:MAG: efflux RND transporter periplasmic adaptor subunit [Bacteroidetes bacterium]|nr:efflux RND transporter periplasmic adaptor subunit [Bacteroidota bacterium]
MNARIAITGVLALIVGFAGGVWLSGDGPTVGEAEAAVYRCPMHPTVVSDRPTECPVCGMDMVPDAPGHDTKTSTAERKVLYWRAPMDPNFTSDKPGKSPMGMDLIPVYEDESAGTVRIDAATVQNIGVKTTVVERRPLSRTIRTVGRVDYDETRITDVNTKMSGWVEKLFVNYTGQRVKKGQPLLEIYSPELVSAQEEYLIALNSQQGLLRSTKRRLLYWDITEAQIAELARNRKVSRTMTVYSPQEGVVVHKAVYQGAHIKAGQHLYRIADLSQVWVYADIYEYEFPWIKEGQVAEVELSYSPGKTLTGEVVYVYPFMEKETRTVKVRMAFPNDDLSLKPAMYANVKIKPLISLDAIAVPVQAVIHSGVRTVIIKSLGNGKFRPVEITLGVEADGFYEVIDGIVAGDIVVTSSHFLIDSESNLKAALTSLNDGSTSGAEQGPTAMPQGHQH